MRNGYPRLPRKLKELIAKGEGLELETKELPSREVIADFSTYSASFANTQGGFVLIGVNKNRVVVGANIDQQTIDRLSQEAANCKPPVKVDPKLYEERGKTLLVVSIPRSAYLHTDKVMRFPVRTGAITSFMDFGMVLAYARVRNLFGGEQVTSQPPLPKMERRKPRKDELKLFVEALSHAEIEVRAHTLKQLSSIAFHAAIETDPDLLLKLVTVLQDPNVEVRYEALEVCRTLGYSLSSSAKRSYSEKLLPVCIKIGLSDDNMNCRRRALEAVVASGDERAVEVMAKLISSLTEEQYKTVNPESTLDTLVHNRLGPKLRLALFREFLANKNPVTRDRISKLTHQRYLG